MSYFLSALKSKFDASDPSAKFKYLVFLTQEVEVLKTANSIKK